MNHRNYKLYFIHIYIKDVEKETNCRKKIFIETLNIFTSPECETRWTPYTHKILQSADVVVIPSPSKHTRNWLAFVKPLPLAISQEHLCRRRSSKLSSVLLLSFTQDLHHKFLISVLCFYKIISPRLLVSFACAFNLFW